MSAVEEYGRNRNGQGLGTTTLTAYADAALAELGAEVQHQVERREEEKLRAVDAEAERDKWADSFKQAEAALEGFLGPDGLSPYERERDTALAERDKWEWVARDACRELAYETHVNPQSPLDYRLANWRPRED